MRFLFRHLMIRAFLVGVLCGATAFGLLRIDKLQVVDEWMFDGTMIQRGERPTHANIVLVGIDDESLARLQKPTTYLSPELAEGVAYLNRQGVAAIGLDFMIPEDLKDWEGLAFEAQGDADQLGEAIQQAGNVVLAKWLVSEGEGSEWLLPLPQWRLKSYLDPKPTDIAFVNLTEDSDQYVRRQRLCTGTREAFHLHFALALHAVARGESVAWDGEELSIGGQPILLEEGKLRINYVGPPGSFPILPLHKLLDHARAGTAIEDYSLKNAIVIIGVTARAGQDYHPTPYANRFQVGAFSGQPGLMNGAEIHAHLLATLHDRAAIRETPSLAMLVVLLALGGVLSVVLSRVNLVWGFLATLGLVIGWQALAVACLFYGPIKLEIFSVQILAFGLFTVTSSLRWRRLRRMMGVVKSEAVARALESGRASLDLRGELRTITVLFSDIRNFTGYSANHTPHEVVHLLNTYFAAIVPLIEAQGGIVNQYMGDGIMVLFNAPEDLADHSLKAVEAAVAMVRRVHEMQAAWVACDFPGFRIGVGIHRGEAIVGTIGSPKRLDYSAIGDTVNVAARIEAENKAVGSEVLISGEMWRQVPSEKRRLLGVTEESSFVSVKGVPRPIQVHQVLVPAPPAHGSSAPM